ncbi:type VI secretion system baseplate subunit TssG [Corallococcus sp. AB004]|nr:type VI secretion system baseplate subunit TssG [Corallococcus exiguus]NPC71207.1 type VI secretion system baseplate subunit TssG [Corallococcus exiguus]NPD25569.1 type VI secretion system baseplate subunit TssG [Corallococcus exiguus]RKH99607.1 type VI secretion system baseplate subunit TssG [Corallococcus sp. AB038B]RKI43074.1 type VI secretion system baseplate subunit TssG [Corallococcus sp. AB004]
MAFQPLVAFLERLTSAAVPVGGPGPASEEAIRFRHDASLAFSAGDVSQLRIHSQAGEHGGPAHVVEVVTTFLGLTGAVSPLPDYIVEEIAQEDPDALSRRAFLDLFHHRLLSLLYRALARYSLEAETSRGASDAWSQRVLALAGVDVYERPYSGLLAPEQLLRLVPLLASRARTGRSLELALTDVLSPVLGEATVTLQQFAGRWVDLEADNRMRLGRANTHLGRSMLLGARLFDRSGRFDIVISPLDGDVYRRLLPEGDLSPVVREVVDLFVRDPLDCALVLGVRERALPPFRLSRESPTRLGQDSYLGQRRCDTRLRTRTVPLPAAMKRAESSARS